MGALGQLGYYSGFFGQGIKGFIMSSVAAKTLFGMNSGTSPNATTYLLPLGLGFGTAIWGW